MSGTAIVADDDDDIRTLIEVAVQRAGYTLVASHADGEEALVAVLALDPDLLVVDHAMPGLTGAEVVRAVRASRDDRRPATVLVSASVDLLAARAADVAADAYVVKPFSVQDLADTVASLVRA